jgi:predicted 3-demethylubiquinone-9 3-methyltransferase (glyoxalase superfamily)
MRLTRISPCLWFDSQAEDAARYYCSIFENSRIRAVSRYGDAGRAVHGRPAGSVLTVDFELAGQGFTALNGGPVFEFTPAISLQVSCETQQEIDQYWDRLTAGGDSSAQQCRWLKDRYGLSWQVVPVALAKLMTDPDIRKSDRVMTALLQMKKLDIAALQRAADGKNPLENPTKT